MILLSFRSSENNKQSQKFNFQEKLVISAGVSSEDSSLKVCSKPISKLFRTC